MTHDGKGREKARNGLRYDTVLFDLDGTILDTNELILASFMHTLEKYFPGKYTREDVIPLMGDTLHKQMARFDAERADELVQTYREHNELVHDELIREVPNVTETLERLRACGVKIGVVTTKQRRTAEMGLKRFNLDRYVETMVCFQDTKHHKPHPEPVVKAMQNLGANPAKTLMVGDSQYDIQAAQNAGIAVCAVAWSIKGADFLRQFHPDYLIDDMLELLPIVTGN
ncbi:pyrophosphatase PpaX [Bacillaceae bacterium]